MFQPQLFSFFFSGMAMIFSSYPQKYDMEIPIKQRPLVNEEGLSSSQHFPPPLPCSLSKNSNTNNEINFNRIN
jgi:hypothetical protein